MSRYHPRGRRVQWQTLRWFFPEEGIRKGYRAGDIDFATYTGAYLAGLEEGYPQDDALRRWVEAIEDLGDFTLLCFEREGEPCHRRLVAQWLKEKQPALELASPLR